MAVQASRTTQPHRPARAFAPSRGILQDIVVEHGAVELLGRFFLSAERMARERGVELSFGTFEELLEVNEQNRDTWKPITTMYDHRHCPVGLGPDKAFVIFGRDPSGRIVATHAGRIYDLDGSSLKAEAESLRIFYDKPEDAETGKLPGERCEVDSPAAASMQGRLLINGAVWYHPDYRKRQLSTIIPRIARAHAHTRWKIDRSMGLMMEGPTRGGVIDSLGYTHREWGLQLIDAPNGSPRCCLAWMEAADELEIDLQNFLARTVAGAQVDAGVDQRRAK